MAPVILALVLPGTGISPSRRVLPGFTYASPGISIGILSASYHKRLTQMNPGNRRRQNTGCLCIAACTAITRLRSGRHETGRQRLCANRLRLA